MKNRKLEFKVKEIVKNLRQASHAYYNLSDPIMPDHEFDDLKDELERLDPQNSFLSEIGAPVEITEWKKAKHKISMTSLNKVHTEEEFIKWAKSKGNVFSIEDKLDGISIDLEYNEDGDLEKAITRGDGFIGEDIYENVRKMQNVKTKLKNFSGSVRGEIFMFLDDFKKVKPLYDKENKKPLKNPRNGSSGIAKKYNGPFSGYLSVLYYDVETENKEFKTEDEKKEFIRKELGLPLCFYKKVSIQEAIKVYNDYDKSLRAETPYDIDGLVIKCDNIELQKKLGEKGGRPDGQIAWKFPSMKKESKILDIEWSLSNKRVTPIAILEPTPIGGVEVRHANIHNLSIFKKFDLGIGDKVLISRRGDVIPNIEKVIEYGDNGRCKIPDKCHVCGSKLEIEKVEKSEFLVCPNENCDAKNLGNLNKWVYSLEIMNIGDKVIRSLYDAEKIKEVPDFYKLEIDDIANLERSGEKSAKKILKNLNDKKEISLPIFIMGLNISNFSKSTAETLIEAGYETIEEMQNSSVSNLVKVKGIEEKTAQRIVDGLEKKKEIIDELFKVGIKIKEEEKIEASSDKLEGKSFCFTGAIQKTDDSGKRYTRGMMHKIVLENGGEVLDKVKKELNYLVMADPNSTKSKAQNARKMGISILSEEKFFEMVEE